MTDSIDFLVRRNDFTQTRWVEAQRRAGSALEPGEVLLRVDRFGLTANNITYGVVGDLMGYWNFFPAPEGWGRIPVWGFADVVASRATGGVPAVCARAPHRPGERGHARAGVAAVRDRLSDR